MTADDARARPAAHCSRRTFVRTAALTALGLSTGTVAFAAPRQQGGATTLPEEILYRTLAGGLGCVSLDGVARPLPIPNISDAGTWAIGPGFDRGRRVLLVAIANGRAWEKSSETRFFVYDRLANTVAESAWPARLAPYVMPSQTVSAGRRVLGGARVDGEMHLFTANWDGTDARELTHAGEGFSYGETLGPDGRTVAFHAVSAGAGASFPYSLFTVGLDGTGRRRVVTDPDGLCFGPSWSRYGEWLAFLKCAFHTDPGHDRAELWIVRPDGSEARRVALGGEALFSSAFGRPPWHVGGSNPVTWSPTADVVLGTRLLPASVPPWTWRTGEADRDHFNRAYHPESSRGGSQLVAADPFGGGVREITAATEHHWDFRPLWLPDGRRVAFIRAGVGAPGELWLTGADGRGERKLAAGPDESGVDHPRFLPAIEAG